MQEEFDFTSSPPGVDGVTRWRQEREARRNELARANGLPLGHRCRVELLGDVVLEGTLRLASEDLLLPDAARDLDLRLQLDRCTFTPREIVSLVRLD